MKLRLLLALSAVFVTAAMLTLSLGSDPIVADAQVPTRNNSGAFGTNSVLTLTALGAKINATGSAVRTQSAATLTAYRGVAIQTATALKQQVAATLTAVNIKGTLTGDQVATQAIQSYASSVLGTTVTVKLSGTVNKTVTTQQALTAQISAAQLQAVDLAVTSYGAVLSNGGATLSYGVGTVTGDVTVDVQDSSLGVYSVAANFSGTVNAASALALAQATFPGIADRPYTQVQTTTGYAWYAQSSVPVIDPKTKQLKVTAEAIALYVYVGQGGKASVTASVGRGQFATVVPTTAK